MGFFCAIALGIESADSAKAQRTPANNLWIFIGSLL
jgi:hypothetical protein